MKTKATVKLVFIPSLGMGHLVSTVEMAKQLVGRDDRLSITVLIMKRPFDKSKVSSSTQSLLLMAAEDQLKFVYLPLDEAAAAELQSKFPDNFMLEFIKMNKQHVRDHVRTMVSTGSTRIAEFVVDMFCTPIIYGRGGRVRSPVLRLLHFQRDGSRPRFPFGVPYDAGG